MKSTDHNLNNPTKVNVIELLREISSLSTPNIEIVSQKFYDLIQIKEPNTLYFINDSNPPRIYFGEILISNDKCEGKYFITTGNRINEYDLYLKEEIYGNDKLIKICKYDDPQKAIDALNLYNNIGSHDKISISLYNILINYIDKDISLNDLLLGIFTIFGFKEDPRLQELIQLTFTYEQNSNDKTDISPMLRCEIRNFRDKYPLSLYRIYSNLYDIIVKYYFFKDEKYHSDVNFINLSEIIKDIINVFFNNYVKDV